MHTEQRQRARRHRFLLTPAKKERSAWRVETTIVPGARQNRPTDELGKNVCLSTRSFVPPQKRSCTQEAHHHWIGKIARPSGHVEWCHIAQPAPGHIAQPAPGDLWVCESSDGLKYSSIQGSDSIYPGTSPTPSKEFPAASPRPPNRVSRARRGPRPRTTPQYEDMHHSFEKDG